MQKITFTNTNGLSVELGGAPFLLSKIEGLGDVEADIQTQKAPYQDGSTHIQSLLTERFIPIEVTILGTNRNDISAKRELLSSVFNPKVKGVLKYENDRVTRWIDAVSEHVPTYPSGLDNRTNRFQKVIIDLICPSPFWTTEEQVDQLVIWQGGLEFPLELPTTFAEQSESKSKILINEGHVETPIRIAFEGPATAPIRVENVTTGEFMEVNQDLSEGELLEINTAFGQKKVEKVSSVGVRSNAFHFVSLDSTFFQLGVGNNLIDYSTGQEYESAGVTIAWRNRYLSV
ncbi:phage tail family protein [Chengkuizengella sp. SCS-71B]|uniref:phage tail family protein n=1 Tax=Chengkuizengella sp. SCS-71B TaxID=3115290 RepID=UPI0032C23DF4